MTFAASIPTFAHAIARFAAGVGESATTGAALETIKGRVIDTLGCMRGAVNADAVVAARTVALRYAGGDPARTPSASVVGSKERLPLEAATFVNGVAARYLDFNDIYLSKEALHPSDNVPVALTIAEALERDGRELLLALLRGYEVHCRLADVLSTRKGGWDNVVMGAIAASVMAGSLLRLDVARQTQAINMAAVGNVALMQTRVGTLSMWKGAAAAYAGRAGLFAALLAEGGFTGPEQALDGTHGLFARVTGVPDRAVFEDPVEPLHLLDTHLKAYPAQYFTQTAIDAMLSLRPQVRRQSIRRIAVSTFEFGRIAAADSADKWQPSTRETADHSMPYCVAVALLDGAVGEAQFEIERIRSADVQQLMKCIEVAEDPELTRQYPAKVPTRIVVEHVDGSRVETLVEYPLGHTRNPMQRREIDSKFLDLAGNCEDELGALWRLEVLPGTETVELLRATLTDKYP